MCVVVCYWFICVLLSMFSCFCHDLRQLAVAAATGGEARAGQVQELETHPAGFHLAREVADHPAVQPRAAQPLERGALPHAPQLHSRAHGGEASLTPAGVRGGRVVPLQRQDVCVVREREELGRGHEGYAAPGGRGAEAKWQVGK